MYCIPVFTEVVRGVSSVCVLYTCVYRGCERGVLCMCTVTCVYRGCERGVLCMCTVTCVYRGCERGVLCMCTVYLCLQRL